MRRPRFHLCWRTSWRCWHLRIRWTTSTCLVCQKELLIETSRLFPKLPIRYRQLQRCWSTLLRLQQTEQRITSSWYRLIWRLQVWSLCCFSSLENFFFTFPSSRIPISNSIVFNSGSFSWFIKSLTWCLAFNHRNSNSQSSIILVIKCRLNSSCLSAQKTANSVLSKLYCNPNR